MRDRRKLTEAERDRVRSADRQRETERDRDKERIQRHGNLEKHEDRDVYSEVDGQETHPAGRGSGNAGSWPECRDKERE